MAPKVSCSHERVHASHGRPSRPDAGVPKSWVYAQSRKGRIPTVTLGRYRRYRVETIEKWVDELEAKEARV